MDMDGGDRKVCIVCGESKEDGITIVTEFICQSCESEIVRTKVEDERYPYLVRQLKPLWVRFDA
jgi:hypothetical protein